MLIAWKLHDNVAVFGLTLPETGVKVDLDEQSLTPTRARNERVKRRTASWMLISSFLGKRKRRLMLVKRIL